MSDQPSVVIGEWVEKETREITHCPSYYAADTETLRTKPGRYPARLTFQGGYTTPMPYWLLVSIDAVRVDGRLYSGFGGNNFASTELKKGEEVPYHVQDYGYGISELVHEGTLILKPGFEWLVVPACECGHEWVRHLKHDGRGCIVQGCGCKDVTKRPPYWAQEGAPKTWEDVAALQKL